MEIEVIESGSGMIECMWMGGRWEDCEQRLFRGLSPRGACGMPIWIQIWQYIPIYPATIPIYALLSDTLGVLGSDLSGGSPRSPYGNLR